MLRERGETRYRVCGACLAPYLRRGEDVVPLTSSEARRLDGIACDLQRSDPALAGALRTGVVPPAAEPARRAAHRGRYVAALGLAALLLTLGIVLHVPVLCMCGWFTLLTTMVARGISG